MDNTIILKKKKKKEKLKTLGTIMGGNSRVHLKGARTFGIHLCMSQYSRTEPIVYIYFSQ